MGVWDVGSEKEIKEFIEKIDNLESEYYRVVGSDDVFDGLMNAKKGAEELLKLRKQGKLRDNV